MSLLRILGAVFALNLVEFLISPISNAIVTKSLSVEHYGVLGYWSAVMALVTSFSALGLGLYNYKMIPGRVESKQYYYLGRTMFLEICAVILSCTIVVLFLKNDLLLYSILGAFFLRTILLMANNEMLRFIGYQKKNVLKSFLALLDARLWVIPLGILMFLGKKISVSSLFYIQTLSSITICILLLFIIDSKLLFKELRFSKSVFIEGLKFGIPLIMVDLGQYLLDLGNRYLLKAFLDYESIGLYNFVSSWISIIFKFGMLFVYVLQPYFAASYNTNKATEFKILVQISAKYMFFMFTIAAIGFLTNYTSIVFILGKEEYLVTYVSACIMVFYPFFLGFSFVLQIVGVLKGDTKKLPFIYFFAASLSLLSNLILIPRVGYIGSAISTIIGYAGLLSGMYFFYKDTAGVIKATFTDWRTYVIPLFFFGVNKILGIVGFSFLVIFIINLMVLGLFILLHVFPTKKELTILKIIER